MKKVLIFICIKIVLFIGFAFFININNDNSDHQSEIPPNCEIGYGYARSFTGAGYLYSSCKRLSDDSGKICYQASDCKNGCEADVYEVRNMCPNFNGLGGKCSGISGRCIGVPGGSKSNIFITDKETVDSPPQL